MKQELLEITPEITVHNLLETYPELEEVLIGIAPPFKKLKNPFLRKTVAKIATIKHIASVGGVQLDSLIAQLRTAVGQSVTTESYEDQIYFEDKPEWFNESKITLRMDESKVVDKNKMTLTIIVHEAKNVNAGEIIELTTSFLPAPGIDILKSKGYLTWTLKESDSIIKSYFLKPHK